MTTATQTTRPVTFISTNQHRVVTATQELPAGTRVYVSRIRDGVATIRVCGTLLEQRVNLATTVR